MRSEDLADEVEDLIGCCRARIMGVGKEQYESGDTQKFETMSNDELLFSTEEEIEDVVNYAAMLRVKVRRIGAMIAALESRAA